MNLPAGTSIFLLKEGQLYLSLRAATAKAYQNCWQTPGGLVETSEDPLAAAQRELEEETGLTTPLQLLPQLQFQKVLVEDTTHYHAKYNVFIYYAVLTNQSPLNLEPHKNSDWLPVPIKDLASYTPLIPSLQILLNLPGFSSALSSVKS